MSSGDLEKHSDTTTDAAWTPRNSSDRILMAIKMAGALTSAQVGERLDITGEAARQQLVKLGEAGLVASESRSAGRGRPAVYWHLTDAGQRRFPDTHATLTVEILKSVNDVLGADALNAIIAARETATGARYRAEMDGCDTLEARVAKLADLRAEEGYMAGVEVGEDGAILLVENHCPICAAATACQGFCRAEKAVFADLLGPEAQIERVEHIVQGGRRCTYRITQSKA